MTLFPLTSDEKGRLQRLNQQQDVVFALKKLFLNQVADKPFSTEVNTLAAERITLEYIKQAFYDLSIIQPDETQSGQKENFV